MKKICVYTCITGNYDNLSEIKIKDNNVDFICFTNNKDLKSKTWKIIYIDNNGLSDILLSRKIKMLGTDEINKYDISIWQDASVIWDKLPSQFVKKYLKNNSFAAFKHSYRDCIYDEAIEVIRLRKESKKSVLETVDFLKKENFPRHIGLYEMTIFIKKNNDKIVKDTMELWYKIYTEHSKRDQLSFMYSAWKTGLKIDDININVWNNEWVHHIKHNYKKELTECRIYYGDSTIDEIYNYKLDYVYKYKIKDDEYSIKGTIPTDASIIEIDITNVPCIAYKDFEISFPCEQVIFFNTIEYNNENVFYNNQGIIRLEGNFKKGKTIELSIKLRYLSDTEKLEFINYLSDNLIIQSEENDSLNSIIEELRARIDELNKGIIYRAYKKLKK